MRSAFFSALCMAFGRGKHFSEANTVNADLRPPAIDVAAQTTQYCPSGDSTVCYTFNVPAQTASSGSGDIYFQIKGPTSKSWIALGQSPQGGMSNANIFIIYANAANNNVTLSPRLGKGNVQPQYDSSAQVFLLDGTGIANGVMTANIRCEFQGTQHGRADPKDSRTDDGDSRLELRFLERRHHGPQVIQHGLDLGQQRRIVDRQ